MSSQLKIELNQGKKIYFASDIHFGEPDYATTRERETRLLKWLSQIEEDAAAIFFVGDIFDFWFEYKNVIPKGNVRFLGRIAELTDSGLPVYIFPGNHDMWMRNYLEEELGVKIIRDRLILESGEKKFFIAHGDGLGPKDFKYKLLKKVFSNPFCQWLFRWLHPDIGIKIARLWSGKSRSSHDAKKFLGPDKEWLVLYAKRKLETAHYDFFIFGHRHNPVEYELNAQSKYVNLGDWIQNNTYGEFDGESLQLNVFKNEN